MQGLASRLWYYLCRRWGVSDENRPELEESSSTYLSQSFINLMNKNDSLFHQ